MDYFDHYDSRGRRWPKVAVACLIGAIIVGAGIWMVTRADEGQTSLSDLPPSATESDRRGSAATERAPTPTVSVLSPIAASTTTPISAPTTTASTSAPASVPITASTSASSPAPPASTTPVTTAEDSGLGYPTSADGSPLPVIVTYDVDTITITGFVPSQATKDRLGQLAAANSKTDAVLENNLVINADVPIGVGVRVIELNSVRFPEGSSEILPAHATELERVANVMQALPNVTVLVIGHADQRGDDLVNYEISAERAEAVVDFLTYLGVSPTRLSSRAVGEADLLTLADDDTALALNRRTEFVFYGLLIE